MGFFGNGGFFGGNDTILWFIILFLLIFCNPGCEREEIENFGCGCGCGR